MEGPAPHTVLAVGDEPDFLERLSHLLGSKGFRPVCRQAANALRPEDGVIHAGILDVASTDSPEGLELCQELRRRCPDASLILTSPFFNDRNWRQTAAASGADCFFNKAWPLETLVSDVRFAVEGLKPTLTTGRILPTGAPKAVVADDDPEWRKLVCLELELTGYLPYEADTGRRALLAIGRLRPDVAILDYMMPDYSGPECIEYIRKNPRMQRVPIIIMTDYKGIELEERCMSLGANDFVLKERGARVLLLRALKSRTPRARWPTDPLKAGPFYLDPGTRMLQADGHRLPDLSPCEFDLMSILIENNGKVVPWEDVERRLHGGVAAHGASATPSAKMTISRLKEKLGRKYEECVVTRRKVGLQLDVLNVRK
ncbi:MAG: response regulator [Elusimicrobia bacterium]|nr:response regulator [Elusimicrobiota bacterium]